MTPKKAAESTETSTVTRLRDLKISARDMLTIDPQIIVIEDGHNPRNYKLHENRAHLDELKLSIAAQGVLVPLLVRFDLETKTAVLVDGECRLRATLELIKEGVEIKGVPVVQVPGNNSADRLVTAITANTGKPFSKWELGEAFRRLVNFGWTTGQIGTKTGYPERFVSESLELADAPVEVKEMLSEQAISPALALSELRKSGAKAGAALKAQVDAARAAGKTSVSRAKTAPTNPWVLVGKLFSDFSESDHKDMSSAENEYMSINRKALRALWNALPEKHRPIPKH